MPNFHHVFEKRSEPRCYLTSLTPEDGDRNKLFEARDKIRAHLRVVIPKLTEKIFGADGKAVPKFIVQGSWAYKTCNAPCHDGQEMDLDYGVYLPISTWEESGLPPQHAAKAYFSIIEEALHPLVQSEGWQFDEGKDTCVRIAIPQINAHVDVPLYVAPDLEFTRLVEALSKLAFESSAHGVAFTEDELDEPRWHEFSRIALAMRDGTWKDSDPRKVADWFAAAVARHGEQLRRVCRYLKGLRDFRWQSGGPSSILLMICAAQVWKRFEGRDDLALLYVLENIGPLLLGPVRCREVSDEDFNRIKEAERHQAKRWADEGASVLRETIHQARMHALDDAFRKLQQELDNRIENAPDLVLADGTAAGIRSYAPTVVPQPQHRESRAG